MKPKTITLEGVQFTLNPLKPRKVLRITKNIVQLIGAGSRNGTKIQIMTAISEGLQSMSDDEFEEFCLLMFCSTQAITKDGPVEITDGDGFDAAFTAVGIENVFVLMYEVLVYNRFPLVRDLDLNIGELIQTISLTVKDEMNPESNNENTENPESSSET
jgi:hypothetical protein